MIAVITVCSAARLEHVRRQQAALAARGAEVLPVLVWLDVAPPPARAELTPSDVAIVLHVPPGPDGLRLAAGRNAGADGAIRAGADLLVFLDADCLPGPELLPRYAAAAAREPSAVLCGPVTYLPEGVLPAGDAELAAATAPHSARPAPAPGTIVAATDEQYPLFWSLSFAVAPDIWVALEGFSERYEGYGAEDTDFSFTLRERGVPLVWVGGADAYHQYHPTVSPPVQHLDDILRNGRLFAERWGVWPMEGWLTAFEAAGVARRGDEGWVRAG